MKYSRFSVQDHHPAFKRSIPDLYAQVLRQGVLADQLGYHSFFVAEHHFHEYGAVPNPAVFLSALSQQTKQIKLGPARSILTFHNPLTVAENYAMLDVLSNGRLRLGLGSGYLKHEFEGYSVNPDEKREPQGWNTGGMFNALSFSPEALTQHRVNEHHQFTASVRIPVIARLSRLHYDNTVSAPGKNQVQGFFRNSRWVSPSKFLAPSMTLGYNYQINTRWGAGLNYEVGWYNIQTPQQMKALSQSILANFHQQF